MIGAAIATIGSAAIGAKASSKASKAQSAAAGNQLALSQKQYDETRESTAPYREAGENALGAYRYNLGLGDKPEGYEGLQETPNYLYQLGAGRDTIESGAAGRGGLYSGATMSSLERFRQGLTSSEVNTQLNRLSGLSSMGLSAANSTAQAGQANVAAGSQAYGNLGNAQAAGAIGQGNAINQGIQSGLGAYGFFGGGGLGGSGGGSSGFGTGGYQTPPFYGV